MCGGPLNLLSRGLQFVLIALDLVFAAINFGFTLGDSLEFLIETVLALGESRLILADFGLRLSHFTIDGLAPLTSLLLGFKFDTLLCSLGLNVGGAN